MVVEDDVLIRFPIAEHLRSLGFLVIEAANGSEAIGVLAAITSIDVVFTDMHMPGPVDGLGVIRWIEENKHRARIILTSGDENAATAVAAANPDAKVFSKPYRVSEVGDCVSRLVGRGPAPR
jgi:DNA-binding NtrC family response regulator